MRAIILTFCLAASSAASSAAAQTVRGPVDLFVPLPGGAVVELNDLDVELRDARMATPLHHVARVTTDPGLIRAMLARGADPAARDAEGRTPLHDAAAAGAPPGVLAALLGGGAPRDAADVQGRTALHLAASPAAAGVLTLAGADPCVTDAHGAPALDPAMLEALRQTAPEAYPAVRDAFLRCLGD
jgi:hypothetical protein